jgi:hypothetical protein
MGEVTGADKERRCVFPFLVCIVVSTGWSFGGRENRKPRQFFYFNHASFVHRLYGADRPA